MKSDDAIRTSQLIVDDGGLTVAIKQLELLQNKYNEFQVAIVEASKDIKTSVEKVNSAQKDHFATIKKNAEMVEQFKEQQDRLDDSIRESAATMKILKDREAERMKQMVDAQKLQDENLGYYEQQNLLLKTLTTQYKKLSEAEVKGAKGQELLQKLNATRDSLDEMDKSMKNFQRNVGNYEGATQSLKKELKELIVEMAKMKAAGEESSEKYAKMRERAGELKDTIGDVNAEVKHFASDTRLLDEAIGIFKGLGAAAQIAEGTQALLGEENEDLTKSIQKMVAVQSLLNGVQELQNALQKESAMMMGVNTIKTKAAAAWQAIYTTAVGTSTGALKAFRVAMLATGIGAIIAGIVLLVKNWDKLTSAIDGSAKAAKDAKLEYDELLKSNERLTELGDYQLQLMDIQKKSDREKNAQEIKNNEDKLSRLWKERDALDKVIQTGKAGDEEKQAREKLMADERKLYLEQDLLYAKKRQITLEEEEKKKEELDKREKERRDKAAKQLEDELKQAEEAFKLRQEQDKLLSDWSDKYIEDQQNARMASWEMEKKQLEDQNSFRDKQNEEYKKQDEEIRNRKLTNLDNQLASEEEGSKKSISLMRQVYQIKEAIEVEQARLTGANIDYIHDKYKKLYKELDKKPSFLDKIFGDKAQEKMDATKETISTTFDAVNNYLSTLSNAADQAVSKTERVMDLASQSLQREIDARNAGYANNVDKAQKEFENAKRMNDKALKEKEKITKAQNRLDTLQQTVSMISATANIWKTFTQLGPYGWALAVVATAAMWGLFAASKVKAAQLSREYGQGGYEFLEGGSHASGNDISIGTTRDGRQRRAEGGETLAIINKKSTSKYRRQIPELINAINRGKLEDFFSAGSNGTDRSITAISLGNGLENIGKDVSDIRKQNERKFYTDSNGNLVEKYKNITITHVKK